MQRALVRTMSSTAAASSANSAGGQQQPHTRSGYFIRGRLAAAASKAVASASAVIGSALADDDADDGGKASKASLYTEERCLVFPGFAYVRTDGPSHSTSSSLSSHDKQHAAPQATLNVSLEGFAFRLRPLGSASRTQKIFVSAVRQLTSLPSLPKPTPTEEPLDIELSPEELKQQAESYKEHVKQEQRPEHEEARIQQAAAQSSDSLLQPIPQQQHPSIRNLRRQDTSSSIASVASASSIGSFQSTSSNSVSFSSASLEALHENLHGRLRLFFSQKLVGRRIRVSVYLLPSAAEPKDTQEVCVAKGTLTSEVGGVFKSALSVPWTAGDPHGRRLRVRTELLVENPDPEETIDTQRALEIALARSDEATVNITHAHAKIRVISDIDDTIKITHVLAGIKAVMRNVFTRPHDELVVPGMKDWYWGMHEQGASFHYLSNSPYEIFGVLREYLHTSGFPPGSIRLKEYGGGRSLLGGLWESAASRKRGGAEDILRTFPESSFLLVGDSGEQDLELYVSLARQFPAQVSAIFIRDVTTPLSRNGRPKRQGTSMSASTSTSTLNEFSNSSAEASTSGAGGHSSSIPPPPKMARRKSDLEQQKLLLSLAKDEEARRKNSALSSTKDLDAALPRLPEPAYMTYSKPSWYTPGTGPEEGQDQDELDDADEFSPNNPLDRNLPASGRLSPYGDDGYTEAERKIVSLFADRVHRARMELPDGVKLVLFRTGDECVQTAREIVKDKGVLD